MNINFGKSKHFFLSEESISKNKSYCFQISWFSICISQLFNFNIDILSDNAIFVFDFGILGSIFNFNLSWTRRRDHAGPNIELAIFGLMIMFNIYDNRHWNYDNNDWEKYEN